MTNTFTLTNLEISYLRDLILNKIQSFEFGYSALLNDVFEGRKKILFASFGFKGNILRGWHKTKPYLDDQEVIVIGEETRRKMGTLLEEFSKYESFVNISNLLKRDSSIRISISLEEINELENSKWAELLEILNHHKLNLTREDCMRRLERIYQLWEINKKNYM